MPDAAPPPTTPDVVTAGPEAPAWPPGQLPPQPPWPTVPAVPPSSPAPRRRLLRPVPVTLALVVLAVAAALGGWLSTRSAGPTATALVRQSLAAARASAGFHYVSTSSAGSSQQTTIGDAGATSGKQVITVDGDTFTVLVVGATAYLQGDATALVENLGLPPSLAQAHSGQWISLVSGDAPYASVYAAVTVPSALADNLTFRPTTVVGTQTVSGQRVTVVRGAMRPVGGQSASGTATLYLAAGGRHLPVRYVERGTITSATTGSSVPFDFEITFSAWGVAVSESAPPGAVPFASFGVRGGTGGGGGGLSTPGGPVFAARRS